MLLSPFADVAWSFEDANVHSLNRDDFKSRSWPECADSICLEIASMIQEPLACGGTHSQGLLAWFIPYAIASCMREMRRDTYRLSKPVFGRWGDIKENSLDQVDDLGVLKGRVMGSLHMIRELHSRFLEASTGNETGNTKVPMLAAQRQSTTVALTAHLENIEEEIQNVQSKAQLYLTQI